MALAETGKVGDVNFALNATITITNHQTQSIAISNVRPDPLFAPVNLHLYVQPDTSTFYFVYPHIVAHEPFQTEMDIVSLTPDSSQSWSVPLYLLDVPAKDFQPGIAYQVQAIEFWHIGPLVVNGKGIPPIETDGEGLIALK